MKTHQAYRTKASKGAECSKCTGWIPPGHKAVLMEPATVSSDGKATTEATAHHGVLCMVCYKEI